MKQSKIKISPAQELVMNIVWDVNLLDIYILSNKSKMPIEGETPTIYWDKDDIWDMIEELNTFLNEWYYIGKSVNIFTSTNQKYTFYIETDNDLIIEKKVINFFCKIIRQNVLFFPISFRVCNFYILWKGQRQ